MCLIRLFIKTGTKYIAPTANLLYVLAMKKPKATTYQTNETK